MAWAAHKPRIRYEIEDTGAPFGFSYVPDSEPYVDAMSCATRFSELEEIENAPKPWVCECGTHNEARDGACHYCGSIPDLI